MYSTSKMTEFAVNEIAFANVFDLHSVEEQYVYYYPTPDDLYPGNVRNWAADDGGWCDNVVRFHKSMLFSAHDSLMPKVEYVTIGFARKMKPTDVITVLEVNGDISGGEALSKFGPKHSDHFHKGTVLAEEMADPGVLDDEVFSWSGGRRRYVKVTKELIDWSVPISERMEELVTPRWLNHYEEVVRNPAEKTRMLVESKKRELQDKIKALTDELDELQDKAEQHEKRAAEAMFVAMDREAKKARNA